MAWVNITRRQDRRGDEGSEIIELAVVLPILLFVIAGIVDFGFLFQRYETVTNAAREGARVAVLQNYTTADVTARVQSYLTASGLSATPTTTITYSPVTLGGGGPTIQVARVVVTYPSTSFLLGPFATLVGGTQPGTITLQAVSEMRLEAGAGGS